MLATSGAYLAGFLLVPAVIGFFAARFYLRRGWPRSSETSWRRRIRAGIGLLVGLSIFIAVAAVAVNQVHSPTSSVTPMQRWTSKDLVPAVKRISGTVVALKSAYAERSPAKMNSICWRGQGNVTTAISEPVAPNHRFEVIYEKWLTDAFTMFDFCERATTSQAFWSSTGGIADWNEVDVYASKADQARTLLMKIDPKFVG